MVLGIFVGVVVLTATGGFGVAAADTPDWTTVSYSGDGSSGNPYEVGTVDHLQCIESKGLDNDYELTGNIDASGTSSWDGGGFDPIGGSARNGETPFTGTFDGNGHTISGLTIDRGGTNNVGLFGTVSPEGTVRNVRLDGGTVTGSEYVGALVGTNNGTVSRSVSTVDITASGGRVGGLVGESYGTVEDSYATGDVTADTSATGGLAGSTSSVTIRRTYATGVVSVTDGDTGGLVGDVDQGVGGSTIANSYWDAGTTNQADAFGTTFSEVTTSGLVGFGATADTEPAPEMQGSSATANVDEFDFSSTWETVESTDPDAAGDGYPTLSGPDRTEQLEAQGLDTPVTSSITRASPSSAETSDDSVDFEVTFPETVENVGTDDFTASGTASGTVDSVGSTSGSTVTVTVASVSGDGSLGLDLAAAGDITDSDGNALSTTEPGERTTTATPEPSTAPSTETASDEPPSTGTSPTTTGAGGPGFGPAAAITAILSTAVIARRRR